MTTESALSEPEAPPRKSSAFAALRHHNYRWYYSSGLAMSAGQGIEQLALSWLVLDLTGSLAQLGLVIFVRGVPMLFVGLFGGVLADRYSRRKIIQINQVVTTINMGTLAALVISGQAQLWNVYVTSILLGIAQSLTQPARQAMIRNLVADDDLMNAVALNAFQMNLSRIVWPTMAGGLIALTGTGEAFVVCAIASFAGIVCLFPVQDERNAPSKAPPKSPVADLIAGIKYTLSVPILVMVMGMILACGMFGLTMQNLGPAFAREVMGFSAGETGVFVMMNGVGALLGSSFLLFVHVKNRNLLFMVLAFGFSLSLIALALNTTYIGAFLILAWFGLCASAVAVVAQATFQVVVPQHYLGRVYSIFMLAPAFSALVTLPVGVIGDAFGLRWAIGGIAVMLLAVTIVVALKQLPLIRNTDDVMIEPKQGPATA